jgi:zinc finger protein
VTTVEGILQAVKADLVQLQPERRQVDPETALKLDRFIERIDELLSLQTPWTLVRPKEFKRKIPLKLVFLNSNFLFQKLHDPTGNCFVQNPNPFHVDPNCITSHYCRPVEEDRQLGFLTDEEATAKLTAEDLADREWKSYEDVKNEVLRFPGTCQACGAPCETRMKPTGTQRVTELNLGFGFPLSLTFTAIFK